jgi:hypothetical protein
MVARGRVRIPENNHLSSVATPVAIPKKPLNKIIAILY